MRYHEYLASGWPIASGPVEGACKNLIKDRMGRWPEGSEKLSGGSAPILIESGCQTF